MKFDGHVVTDSLAMAETLAEQNPSLNMWPADPAARAMARSISAEMHSDFGSLRTDCTMNLRHSYPDYKPSADVLADVDRITKLWTLCRETYGADGPWLFGKYSIADVFYAPVATRLATYNLPQNRLVADYVAAHLAEPSFHRWRAMAFAQNFVQPGYDLDLAPAAWTGPTPLAAKPVENTICPYSYKPVTHFLELEGRIFGFCNPFCRDKTVADAQAWEKFMAIYQK